MTLAVVETGVFPVMGAEKESKVTIKVWDVEIRGIHSKNYYFIEQT